MIGDDLHNVTIICSSGLMERGGSKKKKKYRNAVRRHRPSPSGKHGGEGKESRRRAARHQRIYICNDA